MNAIQDWITTSYQESATKYTEDPLVLACSLYELGKKEPGKYRQLESQEVLDNITDNTRTYSEAVRKYYTRKFLWQSLKNSNRMSDYRRRVCVLLEGRIRECMEKDSGIYYKLPWFYNEDMIYDEFKKQYNTTAVLVHSNNSAKQNLELTYLKNTLSRQQKKKLVRFWFTDSTHLFNIEVLEDNPFLEMFNTMIEPGKLCKFTTHYKPNSIDNMYYYTLFQFNFTKE
jgi:hypothetical protein